MSRNNFYKNLLMVLALVCCFTASGYGQTPQAQRRMPMTPLPDVRFPIGKGVVEIPFQVEGG